MNYLNAAINGFFWSLKAASVLGEADNMLKDIENLQKNRLDQIDNISDYIKVACQIGTTVCDFYVFKKDWDTSDLVNKIKMKEGDVQRIQQELIKNRVTCTQVQALALGTSMVHNTTEGHLFDMSTISRMLSLVLRNKQIPAEDKILNSLTYLPTITFGVVVAKIGLDFFDNWYETYGLTADHITLEINYEGIPEEHHNNEVFQQFICPITLEPIRFPVTAPNRNGGVDHHFERHVILAWLQQNRTNPVNRAPLRIGELRENLQMRHLIKILFNTKIGT